MLDLEVKFPNGEEPNFNIMYVNFECICMCLILFAWVFCTPFTGLLYDIRTYLFFFIYIFF